MMFEEKTTVVQVQDAEFKVWVNPPRGPFEEEGRKGDLALLNYALRGWNIGGKEYNGYKFPSSPTAKAIGMLPVNVVGELVQVVGEAISNTIPKRKNRR